MRGGYAPLRFHATKIFAQPAPANLLPTWNEDKKK
jgi:hypothetical protein